MLYNDFWDFYDNIKDRNKIIRLMAKELYRRKLRKLCMDKRLYIILCSLLAFPTYLVGIIVIGQISLLFPPSLIAPEMPLICVLYTKFFILLYPSFCIAFWYQRKEKSKNLIEGIKSLFFL